jgi:hypothetical protein
VEIGKGQGVGPAVGAESVVICVAGRGMEIEGVGQRRSSVDKKGRSRERAPKVGGAQEWAP